MVENNVNHNSLLSEPRFIKRKAVDELTGLEPLVARTEKVSQPTAQGLPTRQTDSRSNSFLFGNKLNIISRQQKMNPGAAP